MYENWNFERWPTPVSDEPFLGMVSLVDDGELKIVVKNSRDQQFCFTFTDYPAYRNIMEEYRTELWPRLHGKNLGNTLLIVESQWISSLKVNEPLLEIHLSHLFHYMICTADDVLEILTPAEPLVVEQNLEGA